MWALSIVEITSFSIRLKVSELLLLLLLPHAAKSAAEANTIAPATNRLTFIYSPSK
jgi:hypothetical protein